MKGRSEVLVACPFMVRCVRRRGGSHRHPEDERYFRDIYDHLIRISNLIDTYRDLLTSSMDVFLSTVSTRLNVVMK